MAKPKRSEGYKDLDIDEERWELTRKNQYENDRLNIIPYKLEHERHTR